MCIGTSHFARLSVQKLIFKQIHEKFNIKQNRKKNLETSDRLNHLNVLRVAAPLLQRPQLPPSEGPVG